MPIISLLSTSSEKTQVNKVELDMSRVDPRVGLGRVASSQDVKYDHFFHFLRTIILAFRLSHFCRVRER